jgi:hypothetical protein
LCQKATFALQQIFLFDHLVGTCEQYRRHCCCGSACAISAISFLVMALPKELKFSATATNAPAPPMTLSR